MLLCRAIGGEVTTDGDFLIFEGNRYSRRGFLFKSFGMSAIVSTYRKYLYKYIPRKLCIIVFHMLVLSEEFVFMNQSYKENKMY